VTVYGGHDPTDAEIVRLGSWRPTSTRVDATAFVEEEDFALALIDTNADSTSYFYLALYRRGASGWDDAGGTNCGSGTGSGWTAGVYFAYGMAPADAETVIIDFMGTSHLVPVQNGWWLFAIGQPTWSSRDDEARISGSF
jgi:hypothetical protein